MLNICEHGWHVFSSSLQYAKREVESYLGSPVPETVM
jgi:hypothetical protein